MIETKYVVIKTNNYDNCYVENTKAFNDYHTAQEYRDKKRDIERIEKSGYYYNIASFNIIKPEEKK